MSSPTTLPMQSLDDIYSVVQEYCNGRGVVVSRLPDFCSDCLSINLKGASREWALVVYTADYEHRLPPLFLLQPNELLAHVGYSGEICVSDGQGQSIDIERRADVIAYTVLAGYDLLENSAKDADSARTEFFNEYEGYWLGMPSQEQRRLTFEVDGRDRFVTGHGNLHRGQASWVYTESGDIPPKELGLTKTTSRRALYLHFATLPLPPIKPAALNESYLDALLSLMSVEQIKLWNELLSTAKGAKELSLLVSTPRAAGGCSVVGIQFEAEAGRIVHGRLVAPLMLRRHTVSYMRERGGASLTLSNTHVAVIGCGAVGGYVADTLAASGIGKLTLVDTDTFSEDNVFRHLLQPTWIDSSKVYGLSAELMLHYPGLHVVQEQISGDEWVNRNGITGVDGIVVAIGAPTQDRMLARRLRTAASSIPVVFTWLEPLDLGGHALLVRGDRDGCLECLYRDGEGIPSLSPRTSFFAGNKSVSRNLTGCASTFVPYGAIQARRTAILAAEQLLYALAAGVAPEYRFWRGAGDVAKEQGLHTTHWWQAAERTSTADATKRVFEPPCRHCRGGASC